MFMFDWHARGIRPQHRIVEGAVSRQTEARLAVSYRSSLAVIDVLIGVCGRSRLRIVGDHITIRTEPANYEHVVFTATDHGRSPKQRLGGGRVGFGFGFGWIDGRTHMLLDSDSFPALQIHRQGRRFPSPASSNHNLCRAEDQTLSQHASLGSLGAKEDEGMPWEPVRCSTSTS